MKFKTLTDKYGEFHATDLHMKYLVTSGDGFLLLWRDRSYNDYEAIAYTVRRDWMPVYDDANQWLKYYVGEAA